MKYATYPAELICVKKNGLPYHHDMINFFCKKQG